MKHNLASAHDESAATNPNIHSTSLPAHHFREKLRRHVFQVVAELYWFRKLGESLMNVLRGAVKSWTAFALKELEPELNGIIRNEKVSASVMRLLKERLNFFDGLETEAQTRAYAHALRPGLEAIEDKIGPDKEDRMCGISVSEWLVHKLRYDDHFRSHVLSITTSAATTTTAATPWPL